MPCKTEIDSFLKSVRTLIDLDNILFLDKRRKYLETIAELGINESDVLFDIYNLKSSDQWEEPEPDKNPLYPGNVWQCKKILHGSMIYIKLKIKIAESGQLLIMSYHFDCM